MNYPFWDVPVGYGILMATVAVLHVFISHFAIGGGLYLVVTEHFARGKSDAARLDFLERLSKFFVLVTLVAGALTGVGIWFTIGLLSPAGTEVLIHNFVWAWATEWTFFLVEILAAILYYYGWKRMSPRDHLVIGWIYFVFAWLSLFIINGIVTFMLTPGTWLSTGNFWDGFFNPTFWPSLALRSGVTLMLAGLYTLLVASRCGGGAFKAALVRYNALWGLAGLAVAVASLSWYWRAIPASITTTAVQVMNTPMVSLERSYWLAAALAVFLAAFGLLFPRLNTLPVAVLAMLLGLGWFGTFEWFRESIRKPYVISGYMYGNGVEVSRTAEYQQQGYLTGILYRTGDDGADLFRRACRSCHTLAGYKALKPALDGMDRAFIASLVRSTHLLKGNMPPFLGTAGEADAIAGYLKARVDERSLATLYNLHGAELGRKVFELRCGQCHLAGSPRDLAESLPGLTAEDYSGILEGAGDLGEGMPPFTGDATERDALIEFLTTWHEGEIK